MDDDGAAIARLAGTAPGPGELGGRAQDQGRRHRRRGSPSAETASLLAEYQEAMRTELRAVLAELRGVVPDTGLGLDGPAAGPVRPKLAERMKLWDLAIKVGRELGTEVDGSRSDADAQPPTPRKRSRARIDFG